eukprot:CAMPEP_0178995026 /NCGR_PEP_ID=MMETSP0795-20121207/7614_1 /TAXON_ID=88552 /ORGANISM="Amoebophrya sp., Strain Ameob2" /LENGTH=106 /DNA_ID=CAMNT_0020687319 /DNA_START=262 /DNA_END=579 /DNA_ORIENTATION=+
MTVQHGTSSPLRPNTVLQQHPQIFKSHTQKSPQLLREGDRALGAEGLLLALRDQRHLADHREFQVERQHLADVPTPDGGTRDHGGLQHLDRGSLRTVATSHLADHL